RQLRAGTGRLQRSCRQWHSPPPSPPALAQALQSPPKSPEPDGPEETSPEPKCSRYRYAPQGRDESSAAYPGAIPRYPSAQSSPGEAASYQPPATTSESFTRRRRSPGETPSRLPLTELQSACARR